MLVIDLIPEFGEDEVIKDDSKGRAFDIRITTRAAASNSEAKLKPIAVVSLVAIGASTGFSKTYLTPA